MGEFGRPSVFLYVGYPSVFSDILSLSVCLAVCPSIYLSVWMCRAHVAGGVSRGGARSVIDRRNLSRWISYTPWHRDLVLENVDGKGRGNGCHGTEEADKD